MIGILNYNKTRVIFGPKEINIEAYDEDAIKSKFIYFVVDGHNFLDAHTKNSYIFKKLKEKFSEILENYISTFAKYADERNYVFDLSFYNEEINKIISKEEINNDR